MGDPCGAIKDGQLAASCVKAMEGCAAFEDDAQRGFCEQSVSSCSAQAVKKVPADAYHLITPDGTDLTVSNEGCFRLSVRMTKAFWPEAPQKEASSGKGTSANPVQSGTFAKGSADKSAYEGCTEAGEKGTAGNNACRSLVDICLAGKGPYELPMGGQKIVFDTQPSCLRNARRIARILFSNTPVQGTAKESPAVAGDISFSPDQKTRFAVRFDSASPKFKPQVGEKASQEFRILFSVDGAIKRVIFGLTYTVEPQGSGKYRITYAVTLNGSPLGAMAAAEFSATEGVIDDDLAFGITLSAENNFGSVSSIRIVRLVSQ